MKNIRSRPKGYFLTILQENDSYFVGKEKGLPISSRRYLNLGSTLRRARDEAKKINLLDGEHLWLGYQPEDNMPSVMEAWIRIYGKMFQYRSRKSNPHSEGFSFHGVHFESFLPFVRNDYSRYQVDMDKLVGYNFTRDVIVRKDLRVEQKKLLCSLCGCDGETHLDCQNIVKGEREIFRWKCAFSVNEFAWEEHVKKSFPFGVICYKWGVNEKVIEYVKKNLW